MYELKKSLHFLGRCVQFLIPAVGHMKNVVMSHNFNSLYKASTYASTAVSTGGVIGFVLIV